MSMTDIHSIAQAIKAIISRETGADVTLLDDQSSFHALGLDSVNSLFLLGELEDLLEVDIDPLSLYDNPTIASFSSYLNQLKNGAK